MNPLGLAGGAAVGTAVGSLIQGAQERAEDVAEDLGLVAPKKSVEELLTEAIDLLRAIAGNTTGDLSYDIYEAAVALQNIDYTFHKGGRKYVNVYFAVQTIVSVNRPGIGASTTTLAPGWTTLGVVEGMTMRLDSTNVTSTQNMLVVYSNTRFDGLF